jgi:TusA-related sulfurtransferase
MATHVLDILGMRRPKPILAIAARSSDMKSGDILKVLGDCPALEKDVRTWCTRLGRMHLSTKDLGSDKKQIQIRF